ncbi:type VI secretion system tip protein VgrG [Hafnia paralvei]|uniref:type VI secretion system Vgr family protein n=1 Tax=Hafnia paralvei TaxID=546367 RepID=UPI000DF20DA8|nr:type VI secretion system tip protein TssI/VgrG [Hafnia paralvei]RDA61906.1 type VI secretion system tip protein VgrG [Hafnia paralvei]RDA62967.1 type VI secretion system tip protein VgrG [Hafnia paralvei]RDA63807.1 type VI secretion system tip protein VgrG [Hafnia paralvei]RDA75093.1 type VI secretion system tip protein VgrG [Hafnia paralvei]RDA75497.1 type VI secretion system tip protein VgrG [Hafnia paralvei]
MPLSEKSNKKQLNHFIRWNGDIANDLFILDIHGNESLSASYKYHIRSQTKLSKSQVLLWNGKTLSFVIGDDKIWSRHIHGVATGISYTWRGGDFAECIITLEPKLSLLDLGCKTRIWQNISVPEIVKQIFDENAINDILLLLNNKYIPREFCLQYRESYFNFAVRLLQEEGIHYYFKHEKNKHTLVLSDNETSCSTIKGKDLIWNDTGDSNYTGKVENWNCSTFLLPSQVSLSGFDVNQANPINNKIFIRDNFIEHITHDDVTPLGSRTAIGKQVLNDVLAKESNSSYFESHVNAHWLSAGEIFTLKDHPSGEKKYQIRSLSFSGSNNSKSEIGNFSCLMSAIDNAKAWFPIADIPTPQIPGILTAIVVGPASEDIHTDGYGRVKIQFPWDLKEQSDDKNSFWVRVSQTWAGGKFGAQFLPRIGNEVLVSFIQGNPNFPIVIGSIYNGKNTPPFELPNKKNISGFVSRSTTDGGPNDGNQLYFDDKKGDELVSIVAQKDLSIIAKNNISSTIEENRVTHINKGDEKVALNQGNINYDLEKGNIQHNVGGDVTTKIRNGSYLLNVNTGNAVIKSGKKIEIESLQSIDIKVGSNKISITQTGISINGIILKIEGSGITELKGAMTTLSGTGMTQISGGIINIG